jgi:ArsR family transcriptional regulator
MGCNHLHEHDEQITESRSIDDEVLYDVADLFKCFSDSTRIRIMYSLFRQEYCVNDIAKLLNMTVSAISHQLQILKTARLVKSRRDGKTIYYSLADEHVKTIFYQALEHIVE